MAFRFPLATLLRLRKIAEEREERLLGQIQSKITQTQQEAHNLQQKHRELLLQRERRLEQCVSAAELHLSYGQMQAVEEMQQTAHEQLIKLEKSQDQQMRTYEAAHRDLEALGGLREKKMGSFRYQQARQEQNVMDDNFVSRMRIK